MSKKFNSYSNTHFGKELIGENLLDRAVEYIRDNLHPNEVYDEDDLKEWAIENGFVKPE